MVALIDDAVPSPAPVDPFLTDRPHRPMTRLNGGDLVARIVLRSGGVVVLGIMTFIGVFLLYRGGKALRVARLSFLTTANWQPDAGHGHFGIAAVLVGTILIAAVAILLAFPLALGTALYINDYAPTRFRQSLIGVVDLMAAVPSVVYGLWGFYLLQPDLLVNGVHGDGLPRWLATYFGWIPFLHVNGVDPRDPLSTATAYTSSTFVAGIVVAMMVTPIICSIMREVFSQTPIGEREGAYALGATRWGMIRSVVLPFARGGMIGATMLGLGRALGETIGVYLVISPIFIVQPRILQNGTSSISSLIALQYGAATPFGTSALMAAGLALFLITLCVNFAASSIVARTRSGAST